MPSPDSPGLGPPITEVGGVRNTFTLTLDPAFATGFQSEPRVAQEAPHTPSSHPPMPMTSVPNKQVHAPPLEH